MTASTLLLQVLFAWALISMLLIAALIIALILLARQLPRRGWLWRLYYQLRWYGFPTLSRRQRHGARQAILLDERETRAELAAVALEEYERAKQLRSNHKRRAHPNDVFHY